MEPRSVHSDRVIGGALRRLSSLCVGQAISGIPLLSSGLDQATCRQYSVDSGGSDIFLPHSVAFDIFQEFSRGRLARFLGVRTMSGVREMELVEMDDDS